MADSEPSLSLWRYEPISRDWYVTLNASFAFIVPTNLENLADLSDLAASTLSSHGMVRSMITISGLKLKATRRLIDFCYCHAQVRLNNQSILEKNAQWENSLSFTTF